jgi:hypothetical protein
MALLVRKFADLTEVNTLLRGGLIGGASLKNGAFGLDGKTLITTTPSATVTFDTNPEGAQQSLTLKQIIDQINAVVGLVGFATAYEGRLRLVDPATATAVLVGNGTANAALGLRDGQAGVMYAAPGNTAPALVSVEVLQNVGSGYLVTTDEV